MEKLSLVLARKTAKEAQAQGVISPTESPVIETIWGAHGYQKDIRYSVNLPIDAKAVVEIISPWRLLILPKNVVLGMYDLSKDNNDEVVTPPLSEAARTTDYWDVAIYEWKPEYVELRLISAKSSNVPFRVYALSNPPTNDTKRKLDGYLITYYWLTASRALPKTEAQETFHSLAKRVISPKAVEHFLVSYGPTP